MLFCEESDDYCDDWGLYNMVWMKLVLCSETACIKAPIRSWLSEIMVKKKKCLQIKPIPDYGFKSCLN